MLHATRMQVGQVVTAIPQTDIVRQTNKNQVQATHHPVTNRKTCDVQDATKQALVSRDNDKHTPG